MEADVFGDLRDWGRVLSLIKELKEKGELEKHQGGLVRILRFPGNWQIREAALTALQRVSRPSDEVIGAVLRILLDTNAYLDLRILAAHSLGGLVQKRPVERASGSPNNEQIAENLRRLAREPEAPVFQRAVKRTLDTVEATVRMSGRSKTMTVA